MYSQKAVLWYYKYLWNYNTDRQEISGQYLHNENVSGDAVLWRHKQIQDGGRPPFWRPLNHHISVKNYPILIKFGTLQQILNPMTVTWPEIEVFEIQDGGGRHLENRFLAITHRLIVRFQRNFVWGSRRACRQGLHDKNCNFFKSKMADGRHFENR